MKISDKSNIWQAIKFTLFSISAGIVQIVSFTLLSEFVFVFEKGAQEYTLGYYGWSYFISLALSVLWNFTFNRKFTFKSANNVPIAMLLTFLFYVVFTPLSIWLGIAMVRAGVNNYLVLAFTMLVNFITEFLYQRFVVFRNSINTAPKKTHKHTQSDKNQSQTDASGQNAQVSQQNAQPENSAPGNPVPEDTASENTASKKTAENLPQNSGTSAEN